MAWTNWGFDGTINEAQWAQMAGLLGNDYVAAGNGDCLVTSIAGTRSVSVAAGTLYGDGVVSVNSGAETVAMTTPVNGQWYVIALRRTWATNTAALVAIAGATTTTTTPTAAPTSFPTLNTNVGVLTDQPIAWAWCNSANTTQVIFDIRKRAVKSMPAVVATAAERDAKYMSPTQGLQVWRDDLGAVETYYGLYNSSTNPGGRDTAGWYTDSRSGGLIPVRPTSATIVTGTGSANAMGMVSFTGASNVIINGVFTSSYKNYRIIVNVFNTSATDIWIAARGATSGSQRTEASYKWAIQRLNSAGSGLTTTTNNVNEALCFIAGSGTNGNTPGVSMDIRSPQLQTTTSVSWHGTAYIGSTANIENVSGSFSYMDDYRWDGISFYPQSGTFTGTIQVFGYND